MPMNVRLADALAAYANPLGQAGTGLGPRAAPPGATFADTLRSTAQGALDAGQRADRVTAAAVEGKADITDVVTAVAEAELTLQTVVAVRDQVVQAYQDILRMPI